MKLKLLRHATMIIETSGLKLLVDPILSPAGAMPPIENSPNSRPNPLVELPVNENEILNVDAVLLTHTHRDHFDAVAAERLPKDLPVFCQPADEGKLRDFGFANVTPIDDRAADGGISITRTGGRHGTGEIGEKMGPVSGYVLRSEGEPTLYIAGDTVWCPEVEHALAMHKPDIVVLFAGAAQFNVGDPITMTGSDIAQVCRCAPEAKVVVVHMESFNHCLLTRAELWDYLLAESLGERVVIPADGEVIVF